MDILPQGKATARNFLGLQKCFFFFFFFHSNINYPRCLNNVSVWKGHKNCENMNSITASDTAVSVTKPILKGWAYSCQQHIHIKANWWFGLFTILLGKAPTAENEYPPCPLIFDNNSVMGGKKMIFGVFSQCFWPFPSLLILDIIFLSYFYTQTSWSFIHEDRH